ncbi:ABC transporter substrate-binding protein [Micromonospora sp. WMMD882]|uniref:ABC transporter substrate-binding protein n=1 Tax=Micromonospora sp. WMMD882 TaxID=3015151 RepID=UPI00248B5304|nr:ABC transporter substrate-binding protein [Micromonospora sp. WMMD882]WBB78462.1 ABC transporter substrate-binding protein [Micromonospora sp. WMMD882]
MTPRPLFRTGAAVLLVAALTACSSIEPDTSSGDDSAGPGEPRSGGTLTTFASGDPASLDPALLTGYDQIVIGTNILEGLFRLNTEGNAVEPALAEKAEAGADGRTWTIQLRQTTFTNGDPVTADDVKFSLERVVNPATKSPRAQIIDIVAGATELRTGKADEISGIVVTGERALTVTLTQPYAGFTALLASPQLAIVSERAATENAADFGAKVVSAGPFKLGEWQRNQQLSATANDSYWDGRPYLDTVIWRFVPDENTRMLEFESDSMDITWLPPASYDRYAKDPKWSENLGRAETLHTEMFAINMERQPLGGSKPLRQAICVTVDRAAAVAGLQGRANEAYTLLPEPLEKSPPKPACAADADAAEALVAEAGAPTTPLRLIAPSWSNLTKTLELYQANLKAVGIDVQLNQLEQAQYQQALDQGDFDLAWTYRVPDFIDPDSFITPLVASDRIGFGNAARYRSSQVDNLLTQARSSMDENTRAGLYQQIGDAVLGELAYIPLLHNVYVDIHQPRVGGYVPSAMDAHNYRKTWVAQ